ncbi:NRT2 ribosyltransferase, partial [Sapayoa aenigma]|nr:NRT2 ribosyltransferase [Sapayoa aenigma]
STVELLPLVLVLLAGPSATGLREIPLNMTQTAFDDQYRGCREEMMQELPALNSTEFSTNTLYAQVWAKATAQWQRTGGSRLWPELAIALLAYTMKTDLFRVFNEAMRKGGRSRREYLENFHFKVLHFLITEAVKDLRKAKSHPKCLHVYRGVRDVQFTAKPGQTIRFGQFTSTSRRKDVAHKFGTDTFFKVKTCHAASTRHFSSFSSEMEVLIPPFEMFKVVKVTHHGHKTQIQLRSHGVYSKYNCEWLQGDIPGMGTPTVGHG